MKFLLFFLYFGTDNSSLLLIKYIFKKYLQLKSNVGCFETLFLSKIIEFDINTIQLNYDNYHLLVKFHFFVKFDI